MYSPPSLKKRPLPLRFSRRLFPTRSLSLCNCYFWLWGLLLPSFSLWFDHNYISKQCICCFILDVCEPYIHGIIPYVFGDSLLAFLWLCSIWSYDCNTSYLPVLVIMGINVRCIQDLPPGYWDICRCLLVHVCKDSLLLSPRSGIAGL